MSIKRLSYEQKQILKDSRYFISLEFLGHTNRQYIVRFCGDFIGSNSSELKAIDIAVNHNQARFLINFNIKNHNSSQENTRRLIRLTGLNQKQIAEKIGVSYSTLKKYIAIGGYTPYLVQFAIETIIENNKNGVS